MFHVCLSIGLASCRSPRKNSAPLCLTTSSWRHRFRTNTEIWNTDKNGCVASVMDLKRYYYLWPHVAWSLFAWVLRCLTTSVNFLTDGRSHWKWGESSTFVVSSIAFGPRFVQSHERKCFGGHGAAGTPAAVSSPAVMGRPTISGKLCNFKQVLVYLLLVVNPVCVELFMRSLDRNWNPTASLCLFQARVKLPWYERTFSPNCMSKVNTVRVCACVCLLSSVRARERYIKLDSLLPWCVCTTECRWLYLLGKYGSGNSQTVLIMVDKDILVNKEH